MLLSNPKSGRRFSKTQRIMKFDENMEAVEINNCI
jgi:predicted metal-binding protein